MESQPQDPEFRNNPENFHPWFYQYQNLICWLIINFCNLTGTEKTRTSQKKPFERYFPPEECRQPIAFLLLLLLLLLLV